MKKIFILLLFAGSFRYVSSQPYLFYKQDQIIIKTLDSPAVRVDSFSISAKEKQIVSIHFSKNPEWDFSVPLKQIKQTRPVSRAARKILFLSDIEGEFPLLRQILIANKVIDDKYNWIFGNGELVICGDLFDRGTKVTEELWLLYKLENAADAVDGSVHVLLGNHDIMNMSGDWRYVDSFYFAHAKLLGKNYGELFDENTELGKWLRSKNVVEKIGDYLCMHAGMSPIVLASAKTIAGLNSTIRPWYAKTDSSNIPVNVIPFIDSESPFWYRGYFIAPFATQGLVDSTVDLYNVKKIIVGHTIHDNITYYYDGKVIGIDTDWHRENAQGLLLEENKFYRVDIYGKKTAL